MKNTSSTARLRTAAIVLSVAGAAMALAACTTVKGVGTDITRTGEAGQRVITGNNSSSTTAAPATTTTTTPTTTTTQPK